MGYADLEVMSSYFRDISPSLAADMLSKSEDNRPLRKSVYLSFAKEMERGEWRTTHQGIAIGENGNVIDGQHRLMAIIESGMTIRMMVTTYKGCKSALFAPFDLGAKRNASDILGIPARILEPIGFLVREVAKQEVKGNRVELRILRFIEQNSHICNWIETSLSNTSRKIFTTAPIRAATVLAYLSGVDWSGQYNCLAGLDLENMETSTLTLYRKLTIYEHGTTGPVFRHDVFGMAYLIASSPSSEIRQIRKQMVDDAWENAKVAMSRIYK